MKTVNDIVTRKHGRKSIKINKGGRPRKVNPQTVGKLLTIVSILLNHAKHNEIPDGPILGWAQEEHKAALAEVKG